MNELQDILEGVILEHKDKKDIEILEIIEQDLYFKHLKKEDILKYIRETKKIYTRGIIN